MDLRPATSDEHAAIRGLLRDARLPVEDLDTAAIDFIVACEGDALAGVVGVEAFEGAGLLRSLAVHDDHRGRGLRGRLVEAIEARAAARGLPQLVLLTETAATFFARRGYADIAREHAPMAVQSSTEFRSLCPASAVCMTKRLGSRHD